MIYRNFKGKELSLLGFGAMRLPINEDKSINEAETRAMVDYAIKQGINYFDTAHSYHNGKSEGVLGSILKDYPREQFYLATKYPGHEIRSVYDPKATFELQLERCCVDFFDFYLLHNIYENSIDTYMDPALGILDYFKEQKRQGKIRHLGFSAHGGLETMRQFLDYCGEDMEFCQIQLNYVDWTLQEAKEKCELLEEYNIPVWVMEPVRGGRLAQLNDRQQELLKAHRPEESSVAWSFRFLQDLPSVKMILSGMSNMEQLQENVETFTKEAPLSPAEKDLLFEIAEDIKDSIPCTSCRYCCNSCPKDLDIPQFLHAFNDIRVTPSFNVSMRLEMLPKEKQPSACINCGNCEKLCPQGIKIPQMLKELTGELEKIPSWIEICREREAAQ